MIRGILHYNFASLSTSEYQYHPLSQAWPSTELTNFQTMDALNILELIVYFLAICKAYAWSSRWGSHFYRRGGALSLILNLSNRIDIMSQREICHRTVCKWVLLKPKYQLSDHKHFLKAFKEPCIVKFLCSSTSIEIICCDQQFSYWFRNRSVLFCLTVSCTRHCPA